MSKFIDRLKQLSEGAPQPLGFRPGGMAATRLKVQLVASLSGDAIPDSISDADAAFLCVDMPATKGSQKKLAEKAKVPFGACAAGNVDVKALAEAGTDFVVFPANANVGGLADSKIGKVLEIDTNLSDSLLRSLNALAVDAVLLRHGFSESGGDSPAAATSSEGLTWQDVIAIHRVAGMISKPVLLTVPSDISQADLKTVWHAGVDGVVVGITGENAEDIGALRKKIAGLEFPAARRESHTPGVPRPAPEPEQAEDQDGEEDE